MNSFKHNPYQQFSPPQPSPASPSCATLRTNIPLQQQQHHQPSAQPSFSTTAPTTTTITRHSPQAVRVSLPSPPSTSASLSSPSRCTSFVFSRDVSCTANTARGESEWMPSSSQIMQQSRPYPPTPPTPLQTTSLSASTSTHFNSTPNQLWLPRQSSDSASTLHGGEPPSTLAQHHHHHYHSQHPINTAVRSPEGSFGEELNTGPTSTTSVATTSICFPTSPAHALSTTLFIDGLPHTIENQFQLSPYVPPQGRVRVRVKRSRGRDVGFAVYDSVDAASAALDWFHKIRMLKEMVQTSGHTGALVRNAVSSSAATAAAAVALDAERNICGCHATAEGTTCLETCMRASESALSPSYPASPLPVSYEDFLATRHCAVAYAQLLRQSVSLRVEWAHTHEVVHHPPSAYSERASLMLSPALDGAEGFLQVDVASASRLPPSFAPPHHHLPYKPLTSPTGLPEYAPHPPCAPEVTSMEGSVEHAYEHSQPPYVPQPLSPTVLYDAHQQQQQQPQRRRCFDEQPSSASVLSAQHCSAGGDTEAEYPTLSHNSIMRHAPIHSTRAFTNTIHATRLPEPSVMSGTSPYVLPQQPQQPPTPSPSAAQQQPPSFSCPAVQPVPHNPSGRRLPSRTLFVKLTHNFPLPSSLTHQPGDCAGEVGTGPSEQAGGDASGEGVCHADAAVVTNEDRAFFALAQRVCREEFFSEQFAGVVRYRPFLHPPYYGGCFVLFERDTDMQRCLQWMREDATLMTLFAVQPARNDTFER